MHNDRMAAALAGEVRYKSPACPRCGGVERYTSSAQCCECVRRRTAERDRSFREVLKAARSKRDATD